MAIVDSTRDFHTQLATICSAFESLFRYCEDDDFQAAALPAVVRFRDLLDAADHIVGPDSPG